jgi:pimeloyl-ACP methyl ester carboxylesterase
MRWLLAIVLLLVVAAFLTFVVMRLTSGKEDADTPSAFIESADRMVSVDGLELRVREEGNATAPTLIMLHGFSFSLESFDALADLLKNDYRIVRVDLPAHGLTGADPQKRYSNDETVAMISGLMDEMGIMRATLVGNSLGGLVAWRLAALEPDKVRALVLLAPGGFSINGVTEQAVSVPAPVQFYLKSAPEFAVRAALGNLYADASFVTDEKINQVAAMMKLNDNGSAMVERLSVFTLPDPVSDLGRVEAPVLLIWGENDKMIPMDHAGQFAAALTSTNVTRRDYANTGHLPHEERAGEVAEDIRAFLGTVYGESGQ